MADLHQQPIGKFLPDRHLRLLFFLQESPAKADKRLREELSENIPQAHHQFVAAVRHAGLRYRLLFPERHLTIRKGIRQQCVQTDDDPLSASFLV